MWKRQIPARAMRIQKENWGVTTHFSLWTPTTLAEVYPSPKVTTFAKIHLYYEAPSLSVNSDQHQISPHLISAL